jgi:PAS domain S-box-containing protein
MKRTLVSEPIRLALKYSAIAAIWIVSSDFFMAAVDNQLGDATWLNMAKGLSFVAVTGLILYSLASRMESRLRDAQRAREDDLRSSNERLQRAKGLHAALSRANQAALTATEEYALCREISSAMVCLAGLRFVWFAWVDENSARVMPADWSGEAPGYMENFICSVDESVPHGQGPTGRAIREGRPVICNDMQAEKTLDPWREQIDLHGFRASAAMPIRVGKRRGALSAYAGQTGFFDEEVTDLMHRLAADLEHGLGLIAARAERGLLDAQILESEARHRALFSSDHVAMLLIHPGAGVITDATPAAARVLNLTLNQLKSHGLAAADWWTGHGMQEAADRALQRNAPESLRMSLPSRGGGAPRQVAATLSPFSLREESRLLCTLEDVTESQRVATRLHLMQTAIEAAPSGIVIADALGRIEWVNTAFTTMTGYSLDQIVGKNPSLLKSGRQGPLFYEELWETISRGRIWSGDLQNQRHDGSIYWEHMVIAPVVGADGSINHYVAIKQDITSQKDMERQMARTQRLESIGLLAGGIAHDLNNVLAPILMAMDLFKLRYTDPSDQSRLELVRKSAERGAGIVRQVLTFARGVDGERMPVQPQHMVKEVRNLLQETLPRNIEIVLDLAPDLPPVLGDPTQIHQVLVNLGVNARDAMPDGGLLTISAALQKIARPLMTQSGLGVPAGDYIVFSVRDTGSGIPPEILDRICEPFFTTKPRGSGTGLGLSTVMGIVRGHRGGLDIVSRVGKGTEVRVLLPAAPEHRVEPVTARIASTLVGEGRSILVVDDEEPVRAVTGMALDLHGFAHVDAADGREALDIFEQNPDRFAAVILDHMMPRLGGAEVAARIKKLRPGLPIISTSGLLSEERHEGGEKTKTPRYGDCTLTKPFTQGDLMEALARVLASKA